MLLTANSQNGSISNDQRRVIMLEAVGGEELVCGLPQYRAQSRHCPAAIPVKP